MPRSRYYKKRRAARRSYQRMAPRRYRFGPRPAASHVTTKLTYMSDVTGTNINTTFCNAMFAKLTDFIGATDWTKCFDRYRMKRVKVTFIPGYTDQLQAPASTACPQLWYAVDTDGNPGVITPTPLQIMERSNFQQVQLDKMRSVTFVPRVASMVYDSVATTAYSQPKSTQWIDCANINVPHYGLFWFWENKNSTFGPTDYCGRVKVEAVVEFADPQ